MKITRDLIQEYLENCKSRKLSDLTIKAYRIDLMQVYDWLGDKEVNKQELNSLIVYLSSEYKAKTMKRKIASLSAFFEYLVFVDVLEYNPLDRIKIHIKEDLRMPRIIANDDLKVVLNEVEINNTKIWALRDIAVIETLISTGIRVSELCSLRLENVNFKQRYICVYGKGRKERIIYLGDDVLKALDNYYMMYKSYIKKEHYFFLNNAYHQIRDYSVRNIINKYSEGLDTHITPHMFRHTFATLLLEHDVDVAYIQKILGHSSIVTTMIYANASLNKQKQILLEKNPRKYLSEE